jgi:TonB-linked SusC/RagA family outer membrane protein
MPSRHSPFQCIASCLGLLLAAALMVGGQTVHAQDFEVTGTVVSADDEAPLPGVNVVEQGTQNGTSTGTNGQFTLSVQGPDATLVFSFVGFQRRTVALEGRSELQVALEPRTEEMEEVVVTALGIERRQRSLGYSVSKVSGSDVSDVPTPNLGDALSGKLSGVDISNTATGPGGSTNILIRGVSSLTGDNQPLIVVDGVPLDNSNLGSAGLFGGFDMGNGLSSINPSDIQEVSVLKGASAAALYGERADDGVVVITTKSGQSGGIGVTFTSNTTFEQIRDTYDFQSEYGHGTDGEIPQSQQEAQQTGFNSWGARLDGSQMAAGFDGEMRPYDLAGNNLQNFYRTGLNTANTLALNGGNETTTFRFSVSHRRDESVVPSSGYQRTSFLLRGTSSFGVEGLEADVKANYVREAATNRPRVSDAPGNANYAATLMPRSIDVRTLAPGWVGEDRFQEFQFTGSPFQTNPYWAVNRFSQEDTEDRIIGFAQLSYDVVDWVTVMGRIGTDFYRNRRTDITPFGTAYNPQGDFEENQWNISETNTDLIVTADRSLTERFALTARAGGNVRFRKNEQLGAFGDNFNIPGLQTISNTETQSPTYAFSEQETWSLFGEAELSYNDYAFLTVTGRNDVSSTLPVDDNSYFYPSVSGSFVFSDALSTPDWLSFGKVRASWAEVGGATSPYQLNLTYGLNGQGHPVKGGGGTIPLGFIDSGQLPNSDLSPSSKVDVEGGLELGFLNERLGLDLTVYQSTVTNDIVPTSITGTSGFSSVILNVGETRNTGLEMQVRTTPVISGDFQWDLNVNASTNNNEVVSLAEGSSEIQLAEPRTRNAFVKAKVGERYGAITGFTFLRDDQGRLILDGDGLPQASNETSTLGYYPPDWRGGITNVLSYKNFTLQTLIDVQIGGDLYSGTNSVATGLGLTERTLRGREDGVTVEGVDADGNPMTANVRAQDYFSRISGTVTSEFVYDASYVKLREMSLSYRIPQSILEATPLQQVSLGVTGRNLLLLHDNIPNVDPEATYSTGAQGLEYFGVPQVRTFGFRVNLRL